MTLNNVTLFFIKFVWFTSPQNPLDQLSYIHAPFSLFLLHVVSYVKQAAILGSFKASPVMRNKIAGMFHILLSSGLV